MENKTKIALLYDFDKTLCTTDMQNYSFIPSLNIKPSEFWNKCNEISKANHMEPLLSYMYLMLEEAKKKNLHINRESLVQMGKDIKFFQGVESWFPRINAYAKAKNIDIYHYIISSGNAEIIEGSSIYKYFHKVFACEFLYVDDVAVWPKSVVNYTTKTQFLFRINKGVFDIAENDKINESTPESEKIIPFKNMIYIADGLTDVPCMKLVKEKGGQSIAVYSRNKKPLASKLFSDKRVDFICEANYSEGSKIEQIVKLIIDKMDCQSQLARIHNKQEKDINTY